MKKPIISYDDFAKLDIRVGLVKTAEEVEGSQKLLRLTVDFGEDYGVVTILSGIKPWYQAAELAGRKFLFLANMEPKKLMGELSNGMILAVDAPDKPVLLKPPKVKKGQKVG